MVQYWYIADTILWLKAFDSYTHDFPAENNSKIFTKMEFDNLNFSVWIKHL